MRTAPLTSSALFRIGRFRPDLAEAIAQQGGFILPTQVQAMADHENLRLVQVLVRCNLGRLVCAAQDVPAFDAAINATANNWVRDVSLPTDEYRRSAQVVGCLDRILTECRDARLGPKYGPCLADAVARIERLADRARKAVQG